jgi:aminoglycoside phosphotransferase (APT) family kinase protein
VLRRDRSGGAFGTPPEFELLRAASAAGVPVPEPRFTLEDGFVMDLVEGETIPRRILREERFARARQRMAAQCGEILARIHTIPAGSAPALPRPEPGEHPARAELARFRTLLDRYPGPHPTFELAFRRLSERVPAAREPALVHGDFRHGNFIVGPDGIRAVLDWELAHVGDPMEDLGWLCVKSWRFGKNDSPVGGFGTREELFAAYERAGGKLDRDAVAWWEVFGNLRWGIICVIQAFTHIEGHVRSVELAAIGRRVAETEWDLLELID